MHSLLERNTRAACSFPEVLVRDAKEDAWRAAGLLV